MPWEDGANMRLGMLPVFRRKADQKNGKDAHPLAFWLEFQSCFRFGALETLHSHLQWDKAKRGSLFRVQVLLWPSQNNSECNTVGSHVAKPSSLQLSVIVIPIAFSSFLRQARHLNKIFRQHSGLHKPLLFAFPSPLGASLSVKEKVHKPDLLSTSLNKFS